MSKWAVAVLGFGLGVALGVAFFWLVPVPSPVGMTCELVTVGGKVKLLCD